MKTLKLVKMSTHNLRNDEHFQFHTEVKDLVQRCNPQTLKIEDLYNAYLPIYEKVDLALKKITKSTITAKIQEADRARDDMWGDLVETNTAALRHIDPQVREAAKQVKIVLDTYGNIAKKPLNEQTSATYNVVTDLEGPYIQHVTKVGLLPWVVELKARNITVSNLMRDRFDEASLRVDIVLKEARAELDQVYFAMRDRINAFALIEGAAVYEEFIRTLNTIIAKYTAILRARLGRGKKGGKGDEEEELEDTQTNGGSL